MPRTRPTARRPCGAFRFRPENWLSGPSRDKFRRRRQHPALVGPFDSWIPFQKFQAAPPLRLKIVAGRTYLTAAQNGCQLRGNRILNQIASAFGLVLYNARRAESSAAAHRFDRGFGSRGWEMSMLFFRKVGIRLATLLVLLIASAPLPLAAQSVVDLPAVAAPSSAAAQDFSFVTDGPLALGWGRPAELPRIYFHDALPALFTRTLGFNDELPAHSKLSWIFTGPQAGITIELTPNSLRVIQRYYDSYALSSSTIPSTTYPEKIEREDEINYQGSARELTVILDSHLAVQVLLNGKLLIQQTCLFDLGRHQLLLTAPREHHAVFSGALLTPQVDEATVTVSPGEKHQTMLGFGGSPSIPAYAELSAEGKQRY